MILAHCRRVELRLGFERLLSMLIRPSNRLRILGRFIAAMCTLALAACAWPPAPPARTPATTDIPSLDVITRAMLSNDVTARLAVVHFSTAGCTTREGLGGPPKCLAGEADGTLVEFLPMLGPGEGSTLRRAEVPKAMAMTVTGVLGIYRVRPNATREPEYPAGEYALILERPNGDQPLAVRVSAGRIVRLDYVMDAVTAFAADGERWLIAPSQ